MSKGLVFDIQHYCVHDGPGIRTTVFLKGCPLRCPWCCNPESQSFKPELKHSSSRCKACKSCAAVCPHGAVSSGEPAVEIDRGKCEACADKPCVGVCPSGALSVIGMEMEPAQVMERVAADAAFYRNSGGGVTFSGGEPFSQPAFLGEMLSLAKGLGIHTAVETCGAVPQAIFSELAPLVDLFLFDLKIYDPEDHERVIGRSNQMVLENLRWLASKSPDKVLIRFPLVPGYTDAPSNILGIARIISELGLRGVEIEPYHPLGTDKYRDTGRSTEMVASIPVPDGRALSAADLLLKK